MHSPIGVPIIHKDSSAQPPTSGTPMRSLVPFTLFKKG
jgi:hypothetical protein